MTYYDVLRSFEESFGKEEGRKRLNEKYTVISRPVDKRENYIKRCVGLRGRLARSPRREGVGQRRTAGADTRTCNTTTWCRPRRPFTQYAIDNLGITRVQRQRLGLLHEPHGRSAPRRSGRLSNVHFGRPLYLHPQRRGVPAVGRAPLEPGQLRPDLDSEEGRHDAAHGREPAALPPHASRSTKGNDARRARRHASASTAQQADGVHLRA